MHIARFGVNRQKITIFGPALSKSLRPLPHPNMPNNITESKTHIKEVLVYEAPTRITSSPESRQYRRDVAASPGNQIKIKLRVTDESFARGTFGHVYEAYLLPTQEKVAIKRVLQDPQFRNRELEIISSLIHPNVVVLMYFYHEVIYGKQFLHLIMEKMPDALNKVIRRLNSRKRYTPMIFIRVIMFQVFRALSYIHSLHICHRDIKPQNILINPTSAVTKLCDFGTSKRLFAGDTNVSYICSRFYRSPDLILGREKYMFEVDMWAAGCVLGELLQNRVLFLGENRADQIAQIINILGTPSPEEMLAMNPDYTDLVLPDLPKREWSRIFHRGVQTDAFALIDGLLRYSPLRRITAFQAMTEEFFAPLRDTNLKLPGGEPLPDLFDWTDDEVRAMPREVRDELVYGRPRSRPRPTAN